MTTPNNSTTATTRAPTDNHTRGDLVGGRLRRLVDQGIQGVTSNPTIIAKAINGSADYDRQLATLAAQGAAPRPATGRWSPTTSTAPWPCCDPSTTAAAAPTGSCR